MLIKWSPLDIKIYYKATRVVEKPDKDGEKMES